MPKQRQTRSDAGEAEQGAQELVVSNVRPGMAAEGQSRERVKVSFKHDSDREMAQALIALKLATSDCAQADGRHLSRFGATGRIRAALDRAHSRNFADSQLYPDGRLKWWLTDSGHSIATLLVRIFAQGQR